MEQLLAHLVGDYVLQTSHMAEKKTQSWAVAILHAFVYSLPFLLLTQSAAALFVIFSTHAVIDRYRVAAYVARVKNMAGEPTHWRRYLTHTGYASSTPDWLSVWLVIITDNTLHMVTNYFALKYL
jgi:hypothetical protein